MRFFKAILVFAFLSTAALISTRAAPSSDGVYVGTLGSSAIVMKLETFAPDDVRATYYYRRVGRDIELNGLARANGTFKLTEISLPDREDFARIELTLQGAALIGTWAELKGKQRVYDIKLRKAGSSDLAVLKLPSTPAFKQWISENPLDALRFDAPMKTARLEIIARKRVQWMTEAKSEITLPRLPQASASVNNALLLAHYRIASQQLQCVLDDYEYTPKVSLYSSRLFSLNATTVYYCGGAYPDSFEDNYTLDLKTAQQLTLEDLYRFTPVKIDLDPSSAGYAKYIEARAKVLQSLILKYGVIQGGIAAESKEGLATNNDFSQMTWHLTVKGLVVRSSLPHVMSAGEQAYELPYSSLVKYLAPNSPLR